MSFCSSRCTSAVFYFSLFMLIMSSRTESVNIFVYHMPRKVPSAAKRIRKFENEDTTDSIVNLDGLELYAHSLCFYTQWHPKFTRHEHCKPPRLNSYISCAFTNAFRNIVRCCRLLFFFYCYIYSVGSIAHTPFFQLSAKKKDSFILIQRGSVAFYTNNFKATAGNMHLHIFRSLYVLGFYSHLASKLHSVFVQVWRLLHARSYEPALGAQIWQSFTQSKCILKEWPYLYVDQLRSGECKLESFLSCASQNNNSLVHFFCLSTRVT